MCCVSAYSTVLSFNIGMSLDCQQGGILKGTFFFVAVAFLYLLVNISDNDGRSALQESGLVFRFKGAGEKLIETSMLAGLPVCLKGPEQRERERAVQMFSSENERLVF